METLQIASIVIFVAVMALIVSERIHRTLAAMLGAVVVMISGIVPFEDSIEHIDFNTIGVLIGMMLFVAVIKRSGLFEFIAVKAAKMVKGDPWKIMVALSLITAVLSAFLDNVTTVLLIGPMTFMICRELKLNPVPYFVTQIISSNIGGTATLIGDPPNIMIGSQAGLNFADFVIIDGPVVVIIMLATLLAFRFLYKNRISADAKDMAAIMELDENESITSRSFFIKSIVMVALVAIAFLLHGVLHLESAVIALAAAAIMMLIGKIDIEDVVHGVEWSTIGFFVGLFIVVGGMVQTGVIEVFAHFLVDATQDQKIFAILAILVASAVISAILDNIPFVATMIPVILTMGASGVDIYPLWWALSLGACLGGNGTLIGASANVVLSGISNREGYPLTFLSYLKVGAPLMLVSIAISAVYLVILFGL